MTKSGLYFSLVLIVVVCVGGIGGMYLYSQKTPPLGGGFSRHFITTHALAAEDTISLGYDSYYLAGTRGDTVYFGNKVGPSHVLLYDLIRCDTQHLRFQVLNPDRVLLGAMQLRVDSSTFFLYDGSVPIVFRSQSNLVLLASDKPAESYFVQAIPRDEDHLFVYGYDSMRRGRLGLLEVSRGETDFSSSLLSRDGDGVFSLDGMMHYDRAKQRFLYLYHYRNEFLVTDSLLHEVHRGHTVDTNRVASIHVARKSDGTLVTRGHTPVVNMHSSVAGEYLFVHSKAISDHEAISDFKAHEVIDVYHYGGSGYVGSFYLSRRDHDDVRSFAVVGTKLMVLYRDEAVVYELPPLPLE